MVLPNITGFDPRANLRFVNKMIQSNTLNHNLTADLVIVDGKLTHEIFNVPKNCDVKDLLGFRMVNGEYYFTVEYRTRKLTLHRDYRKEFGLMVPNDELRFSLGLEKTALGYISSNGSIRFSYPTLLHKVWDIE